MILIFLVFLTFLENNQTDPQDLSSIITGKISF